MTGKDKILLVSASTAAVLFLFSPVALILALVKSHVTTLSAAASFSDGSYTIRFISEGDEYEDSDAGPAVYSIRSDGSGLTRLKDADVGAQRKEAAEKGVEDMMGFEGDFRSPEGKSTMVFRTPLIPLFSELYVHRDGRLEPLMWGTFYELEWLPDSRRLLVVQESLGEGKLGILDTRTKKYAPLARAYELGSISVTGDCGR